MNYFNKNRFIFWLLIILVIINISALVTFFIFYQGQKKQTSENGAGNTFRTFKRELSLSSDQSERVTSIHAKYRQIAEPISQTLKLKRSELLEEMAKEHPDTLILDKYADEIGSLQKDLQRASIRHYLDLKKVCDPQQCGKLSSFYHQLYGGKEYGMGQGKRMQNRFRHGQKY